MGKRQINNFVHVGSGKQTKYLNSVLFVLDKTGHAVLEGLGSRREKTLEIGDRLAQINGVEVGSPSIVHVQDSSGIKIEAWLKKGEEAGI